MLQRIGMALVGASLLGMPPAANAQSGELSRAEARALRRTPVVDVFERSRDAVVNISSTEIVPVRGQSPFRSFFDDMTNDRSRTRTRTSVGSGFLIHADGYLVTNAHVVASTAEQKVIFADGREYDAQIVASDPARDLAVLKIEAEETLIPLPLGRSDDLMIGETVIAIGNPLGFEHTVTAGVVSAVDRSIDVTPQLRFDGLIQTDASINPGNSGGPLLNVLGELIGINSAIRGDAQNIGFAIPVGQLREVLPDLLDVERRNRLVTGLSIDCTNGPMVAGVEPRSPAAAAGLRRGDELVSIDGRPVREGIDFDIALLDRSPGDRMRLRVDRGGELVNAVLRLGERPRPDGAKMVRARLGLELAPVSRRRAESMKLRGRLLEVTGLEPEGPADLAGVQVGDLILALGRHYVTDIEDLGDLLEPVEPGVVAEIEVFREEPRRRTKRRGPIEIR